MSKFLTSEGFPNSSTAYERMVIFVLEPLFLIGLITQASCEMSSLPQESKQSIDEAEKVVDYPNKRGTSHQSELDQAAALFRPSGSSLCQDAEFVEDEEVHVGLYFYDCRVDSTHPSVSRQKENRLHCASIGHLQVRLLDHSSSTLYQLMLNFH